MAIGWIKLSRQIQECDLLWDSFDEPFDRRSAWIDLLLMANHRDKEIMFNGKTIIVERGQRITSMRALAEKWHWSREKVKRYLDLLESENMIIRESDRRRTLLTIVNYSKFQDEQATDEPPIEPQNEPQNEPQKSHRQSHRQVINKNDKNDKNDKKDIYGEYKHVRLTDQEREKLINDYGQQMVDDSIRFLDEYIEMKGYKAKSHYLCIKKWVVDAVKKQKNKPANNLDDAYEMMRQWAEEGS